MYLVKSSKHAGIYLNPDECTLELYPKGYTQLSYKDARPRQVTLKKLWEQAVMMGTENQLYPFGTISHTISLVPDPNNSYDKNALQVILHWNPIETFPNLNGKDLGFIPSRISEVVNKNLEMISGGRILKVRANWHKKYYTAKVILGYNGVLEEFSGQGSSVRFLDIMDEI